MVGKQGTHVARREIEQVAVEQLHALIACRCDIGEGAAHVAEGSVGKLRDRGDADGASTQLPPAIGMIGQFAAIHGPLPSRYFHQMTTLMRPYKTYVNI